MKVISCIRLDEGPQLDASLKSTLQNPVSSATVKYEFLISLLLPWWTKVSVSIKDKNFLGECKLVTVNFYYILVLYTSTVNPKYISRCHLYQCYHPHLVVGWSWTMKWTFIYLFNGFLVFSVLVCNFNQMCNCPRVPDVQGPQLLQLKLQYVIPCL